MKKLFFILVLIFASISVYANIVNRQDVALRYGLGGQVLANPNAQVWVYSAGTNSIVSLFTDSTGNTPLSQPVISNKFGNYSYYANEGVYDEVIIGTNGTVTRPGVVLAGSAAYTIFTTSQAGLAPASNATYSTTEYLRGDGTWTYLTGNLLAPVYIETSETVTALTVSSATITYPATYISNSIGDGLYVSAGSGGINSAAISIINNSNAKGIYSTTENSDGADFNVTGGGYGVYANTDSDSAGWFSSINGYGLEVYSTNNAGMEVTGGDGTAIDAYGLITNASSTGGLSTRGTITIYDPTGTNAVALTNNGVGAGNAALSIGLGAGSFNIDKTGAVTTGLWNGSIITSAYGGTGNGFTKFSGPTTAEKTFTLPNANATLLYSGGTVTATSFNLTSNCSSTASPAVCSGSSSGSFVISAATTTVAVNTTAVTANSQIFVIADSSLGTKLGVTCNTQSLLTLGTPKIIARTAGTSFTAAIEVAPTTNPLCVSYWIVN